MKGEETLRYTIHGGLRRGVRMNTHSRGPTNFVKASKLCLFRVGDLHPPEKKEKGTPVDGQEEEVDSQMNPRGAGI